MKPARPIVLALAVAAACTAQAQTKPKEYVNVLTVHTKPDGALDYEAFVKKVTAAAEKVGQTQRVVAFQVTTGGPGYTYMFATYFDKWAETEGLLSTPEILMKALGEVEGAKVLKAGRLAIESTESAVYKLLPDLSTKARAYDPPPAYLAVIRTHVKPSMTREWERVIGRYRAAAEQSAEVPSAIRRASVQGPSNVYLTSSPFNKAGERDSWPSFMEILKKAYGEEEARNLDQRRRDCTEKSETFVLKYRPDLSRNPK